MEPRELARRVNQTMPATASVLAGYTDSYLHGDQRRARGFRNRAGSWPVRRSVTAVRRDPAPGETSAWRLIRCRSTPIRSSTSRKLLPRCKFRIRFRKAGDLRLVSHHDLMHVFERMLRRADLPFPVTQGFNPQPRMWFALSLALGVVGLDEVARARTRRTARRRRSPTPARSPGPARAGHPQRARDRRRRRRRQVRRALLSLALLPAADGMTLPQRVAAFAGAAANAGSSARRPQPRRVNLRPFVDELHARDDRLEMASVDHAQRHRSPGRSRHALGLGELLDDGAVIERTDLEMYDELPPGTTGHR